MSEIMNILIVGNDPIITMSTGRVLTAEGYNVEGVLGTQEAMHMMENSNYDLVLTDLSVMKAGGIDLIRWTAHRRPAIGILVVAGDLLEETIREALKPGVTAHTMRPFIPAALKNAIHCAAKWRDRDLLKNKREEEFPPSRLAQLDTVIQQYRGMTISAIPVLLRAQEIFGYLPPGIQSRIAKGLNVYPSEISGISSFYSCFRTQPSGDHTIKVCRGYSCYLKGGEEIIRGIRDALEIGIGDTTMNREFTLEDVNCAGACSNAPVMVIDRDIYGEVSRKKAAQLIDRYAQKTDRLLRKSASEQS